MDPTLFSNHYKFGDSEGLGVDYSTRVISPPEKYSICEWDQSSSSGSNSNDADSVISDSESRSVTFPQNQNQNQREEEEEEEGGSLFVRLGENDAVHELIKRRFLEGVAAAEVVAIRRNACLGAAREARVRCFGIYERAVGRLRGGKANVKYAWYGTRGEEEAREIVTNGFGHGHGDGGRLCFSSDDSPLESVKKCVGDKDGVRHLLLCRVILGRSELVHPSNKQQCNPSSEDYDSGLDTFPHPKNYIIWSTRMNTHVLPAYVISFRIPSSKVVEKSEEEASRLPSSPWVPFQTLISVLSKVLPQPEIDLISMLHKDHKDKKISRHELIQKLRLITGDKLLIAVIKSYRAKKKQASFLRRSENGSRTASKLA